MQRKHNDDYILESSGNNNKQDVPQVITVSYCRWHISHYYIYIINIQFPSLEVKDAVSVSCMDVYYSVMLEQHNANDENKNNSTVTRAFSDAIDEEEGDCTSLSYHF